MTFEKVFLLLFTLFLLVISPFVLPIIFIMAFFAESGSEPMNNLGRVILVAYPLITAFLSYRSYKILRNK